MAKKGPGFVPCTTCGGTGATTRTEIVMERGKTVTRTVRVVCTTCGGAGGFHV